MFINTSKMAKINLCLAEHKQVHTAIGCKNAWAFDATAACSGFLVGLITATRFIKGSLSGE